MTTLSELVNNSYTDKNTTHSYLNLYQNLLQRKKETAKHVLEIGIGDFGEKNGGSIKLWKDYFKNATIYGLDILPISRVMDELITNQRVKLYTSINAYDETFFTNTFLNKNPASRQYIRGYTDDVKFQSLVRQLVAFVLSGKKPTNFF